MLAKRFQGAEALPDPKELVHRYLAAMEARDLAAAEAMLGEGFTMQFPGAEPMQRLQELTNMETGKA